MPGGLPLGVGTVRCRNRSGYRKVSPMCSSQRIRRLAPLLRENKVGLLRSRIALFLRHALIFFFYIYIYIYIYMYI